MTQLRKVWVYLLDEEAKELDAKGVVELKTAVPSTLGKVYGFKEKPQC